MADNYKIHIVAQSIGLLDAVTRRLKSKSVDKIHFVKSSCQNASLTEELLGIITTHNIDLIIPAGHGEALMLSKAKVRLSEFCKVLVEDYEKMIRFLDKGMTVLMATELGIPVPLTVFPKDVKEIRSYAATASYPVVVKARQGTGATGVRYARNAEELVGFFAELSEKSGSPDDLIYDRSSPILQEYIPGELHDVTAFCVNGEMKLGLTQERVVTRPLSGGPGIVNLTTRTDELLEFSRTIVCETQWTGVLLLDFKIDERDGKPRLLEVNPRFWGTTWLTVRAGYNYPHYLVLHAMGQHIDLPKNYEVGLMARWPLKELLTIFDRPMNFRSVLQRTKEFVLRFRHPNCVYDILPSDINPLFADIADKVFLLLEGRRS